MKTSSSMWDQIELKIPKAIEQVFNDLLAEALTENGLTEILRNRYEKGSEEHGGEWLDWERPVFWENFKEEAHDLVLYQAMNLVRHDHARKYGDLTVSYNQAVDSENWKVRASLGTWQDSSTTTGDGESE